MKKVIVLGMFFLFLTGSLGIRQIWAIEFGVEGQVEKFLRAAKEKDFETIYVATYVYLRGVESIKRNNPKVLWDKLITEDFEKEKKNVLGGELPYWTRYYMDMERDSFSFIINPTSDLRALIEALNWPCEWKVTETRREQKEIDYQKYLKLIVVFVSIDYPEITKSPLINSKLLKTRILKFYFTDSKPILYIRHYYVKEGDVYWDEVQTAKMFIEQAKQLLNEGRAEEAFEKAKIVKSLSDEYATKLVTDLFVEKAEEIVRLDKRSEAQGFIAKELLKYAQELNPRDLRITNLQNELRRTPTEVIHTSEGAIVHMNGSEEFGVDTGVVLLPDEKAEIKWTGGFISGYLSQTWPIWGIDFRSVGNSKNRFRYSQIPDVRALAVLVILGRIEEAGKEDIYCFQENQTNLIVSGRPGKELPILLYYHCEQDGGHAYVGAGGSRVSFEIRKFKGELPNQKQTTSEKKTPKMTQLEKLLKEAREEIALSCKYINERNRKEATLRISNAINALGLAANLATGELKSKIVKFLISKLWVAKATLSVMPKETVESLKEISAEIMKLEKTISEDNLNQNEESRNFPRFYFVRNY
jgi:predicted DNA-binding transcriptional regulator